MIVPRGGGRRRKSMEPRALANLAGNLVPASSEIAQTPAKNAISPTEEFLTFNTPASRRENFIIEPRVDITDENAQSRSEAPSTPIIGFSQAGDEASEDGDELATPYHFGKNTRLVQQTCPPKQSGEMMFAINGNGAENHVRRKLLEARRKSMAFASKTKSPLGRTVSYGGEKSL